MTSEFQAPRFEAGQKGMRVLREFEHDPYHSQDNLPDRTTCPVCHASVRQGRWRWVSAPDLQSVSQSPPPTQTCPACRRIAAHDPAGIVQITGAYSVAHHPEIMALIEHESQREMAQHPLERIFPAVDNSKYLHTFVKQESKNRLQIWIIATTGIHLARALGHALERSHKGQLTQHYLESEHRVQIQWHRD